MQIRAGSDIAFLGGMIRHVLASERWNADEFFQSYLRHYTNAGSIIEDDFRDVDELGGLFSGWNREKGYYCPDSWQYEGQHRVIHLADGQGDGSRR